MAGGQKFQGDFFRIVFCQILLDLASDLSMVVELVDGHRTGIKVDTVLMAINQNKEIFK